MNGESPDHQQPDPRRAIMALHRVAGSARKVPLSAARIELGDALLTVANSDTSDVTPAAKLNILGKLIQADKPGFEEHKSAYHALAASISDDHGLVGGDLLADLDSVVDGEVKLEETTSGQALPHQVTAFFMEDVCNTATVTVDGIEAAWIFSEFETDAGFDEVAEWVDPNNWPKRSPTMFKGMKPVNPITQITSPQNVAQWHGLFLETVQLVDVLNTELWCDFYRLGDAFAGMSYSLARSVDNQIDVDRGFLLVNELGRSRHVKALKIVSFTTNVWDDVALWVCPLWTDFVRGAVKGGTKSDSRLPSSAPGTVASAIEQWASFASDSAREYVDLSTGWARNVASGNYRADDMARDGARFWLQAYRDMLNAGALSYSILEQLAGQVRATGQVSPVGVSDGGGENSHPGLRSAAVNQVGTATLETPKGDEEGTTQPTPDLDPTGGLITTDLTRIGAPQRVIPAKSVKASPVVLDEKMNGVQIEADVSTAKEGLYIGDAVDRKGNKAPVQLYVSRAVKKDAS